MKLIDFIKDEIKFLEKLKNFKTGGRYVYETKHIDIRLRYLNDTLARQSVGGKSGKL